jgi:GTPase
MVVSAKQDLTENLKSLLILGNNMQIPVITVVTMVDLLSKPQLDDFVKLYKNLIKSLKMNKVPLVVSNVDDMVLFARNLEESIHPIFLLSNKNGFGIDYLINFMNLLPIKKKLLTGYETAEFDIQEHFMVDKKIIVGGIVTSGKITAGEKYFLGPDKTGNFRIVEVEDIHCKKLTHKQVTEGQFSSLKIIRDDLRIEDIRKGMCLIDLNESPMASRIFEAEIWSADNTKRQIKFKNEPVVTIKHIRQICKLKKPSNDVNNEGGGNGFSSKYQKKKEDDSFTLSPDDRITIQFEFKNYPEYIKKNDNIIIFEGCFKAFGVITNIIK